MYLPAVRSYVQAIGGELDLVVRLPRHPPLRLQHLGDVSKPVGGSRLARHEAQRSSPGPKVLTASGVAPARGGDPVNASLRHSIGETLPSRLLDSRRCGNDTNGPVTGWAGYFRGW